MLALALCAGCRSPKGYNIVIIPKTTASVEVDLVGAKPSELDDWKNYGVGKYFQLGDSMRKSADKFSVTVAGGQASPSELSRTNAHWQTWFGGGVTHLVILANLPGDFSNAGLADPRRKEIDLTRRFVNKKKKHTVEVEIQDARIVIKTPQK